MVCNQLVVGECWRQSFEIMWGFLFGGYLEGSCSGSWVWVTGHCGLSAKAFKDAVKPHLWFEFGTNSLFLPPCLLLSLPFQRVLGASASSLRWWAALGAAFGTYYGWVEEVEAPSQPCFLFFPPCVCSLKSGKLAASDSLFNPRAKVVVQRTCCGLLTSLKCYCYSLSSTHRDADVCNASEFIVLHVPPHYFLYLNCSLWLVCNFVSSQCNYWFIIQHHRDFFFFRSSCLITCNSVNLNIWKLPLLFLKNLLCKGVSILLVI